LIGTRFDPKKSDATKHPIKPAQMGTGAPTVVVFPFVIANISSAEIFVEIKVVVDEKIVVIDGREIVIKSVILLYIMTTILNTIKCI
jgi:hypothetical protein